MNRKALLTGLLGAVLPLCGCLHLSAPRASSTPSPVPCSVSEQFAQAAFAIEVAQEQELEVHREYRHKRIELKIPSDPATTNSPLVLDYYELTPKKQKPGLHPVILLLPMAGGNYAIERHFARYFARRSFAVVIAQRRKIARGTEPEAINAWLKQSVQDNQLALDWIETRPELDANRIALFGISLGGIKGVLLTALDHRIEAAVLGLAGGDLPYIVTHSAERGLARKRDAVLSQTQLTLDQLEEKLREVIEYDPNDLAACIDPQKVLLVLAVFDKVVPFKKGWELRANLGKPETVLLPTGHYSAALGIPCIKRQSLRFLQKKLKPAAPPILQSSCVLPDN